MRGDAGDRRDDGRVAEVPLGVLDRRRGLNVVGKLLQRRINRAAQLDDARSLLLLDEGENLLRLDQRGGGGVEIDRRSRPLAQQRGLAVIVGLADLDRRLAHFDLILIALVGKLQVFVFEARRREPALRQRQGRPIGGRVDLEQFVADPDMLPFDDVDPNDGAGDLRGDHHLLGADVGVVGGDVAPPCHPPVAARDEGDQRQHDEQDETHAAAARPFAGRGGGRRDWSGGRRGDRRGGRRRSGGRQFVLAIARGKFLDLGHRLQPLKVSWRLMLALMRPMLFVSVAILDASSPSSAWPISLSPSALSRTSTGAALAVR